LAKDGEHSPCLTGAIDLEFVHEAPFRISFSIIPLAFSSTSPLAPGEFQRLPCRSFSPFPFPMFPHTIGVERFLRLSLPLVPPYPCLPPVLTPPHPWAFSCLLPGPSEESYRSPNLLFLRIRLVAFERLLSTFFLPPASASSSSPPYSFAELRSDLFQLFLPNLQDLPRRFCRSFFFFSYDATLLQSSPAHPFLEPWPLRTFETPLDFVTAVTPLFRSPQSFWLPQPKQLYPLFSYLDRPSNFPTTVLKVRINGTFPC